MDLDATAAATLPGSAPLTGDAGVLPRGAAVGRYVLLGELGSGGMGVVYAAYDPELDRKVAIKLVLPARDPTDDGRARLLREAQALAKLSHPNVVTVHDVGTHGEQVWIAMEFVAGETLGAWARRPHRWPEALQVLADAARGVAVAHAAGLVHRDLKPDNVMIGDDGRVRVMDFGLAHGRMATLTEGLAARPDLPLALQLTAAGAIQGTPSYMAPEQWQGQEALAAADQFGWSVMAWEVLYGERPFAGDTVPLLAAAVLADRRRPPPRGREVPAWLRRVIERGLAGEPTRRWPSMTALLAALEQGRTRARARAIAAALAGVALMVAAAAGYHYWDHAARVAACQAAGAEVDAIWGPEIRSRVRDAFAATKLSYATTAADKVVQQLDQQAAAWRAAQTEVCLDAEVRGVWSDDLRERAAWCLDERRMTMRALVAEFAEADAMTVQRAVSAITSARTAADCRDVDGLAREPAPPNEGRAAIEDVRAELSRSHALELAGDFTGALAAAAAARTQLSADAIAWRPLEGAVYVQHGAALRGTGAYEEAERVLADGYFTAAGAGAWETATRAATELIVVVGFHRGRHGDGHAWARHAELALELAGDPLGLREARRIGNRAIVHRAAGEFTEAAALHRRALEVGERVLGPEHPDVAMSLSNLALAQMDLGALDDAAALFERALALHRATLGAGHPDTATTLHRLASVMALLGDYPRARGFNEQALAIRREALGSDHPETGKSINNLGLIRMFEGDYLEARALFEEACALWEKTLGPEHPDYARCLDNLAAVHVHLGAFAESEALRDRAQAIFEKALGPEHPTVALALMNRAFARAKLEQFTEAEALYRRALALFIRGHGEEYVDIVAARLSLGETLQALGRPAEARSEYERALTLADKVHGRQSDSAAKLLSRLADLQLTLRDFATARRLAGEARDIAEKLGEPDSARLAEALGILAAIDLAERRPVDALPSLERATVLFAAIAEVQRGEPRAQFDLAKTLLATGGDRSRALELARQAIAGYRDDGTLAEVAAAERWLAKHARAQ